MSRTKTERQRKSRAQWIKRFSEWKASEMTQSEYCNKNNLNLRTFQGWRKKLRDKNGAVRQTCNKSLIKVVELQPKNDSSRPIKFFQPRSPIKLQIGDTHVELDNTFSQEALTRLIQVLKTV